MDLEMVLNELSLQSPAEDIRIARRWMVDLIDTVRAASKQGVKKVIRTHGDLNYLLLAFDYPLSRWRNDNEVDREIRRFFTSLVTKAPFLVDVPDSGIEDRIASSDFFYEKDRATGLGIAFLLNALAISLRSERRWYPSHLKLTCIQLDDD